MPDRSSSPDTRTAEEVFFAFFTEVGIIEHLGRTMFEARLPQGFTLSQFTVLNHLIRVKDGRTPLELARAFQVPKTSMTHSLAMLERRGLIRMTANRRDGRSKCVWITDEGRAFRREAVAGMAPDVAEIAARFPVGRVSEVLPTMSDLRAVMDAMRDPDPREP